MYISVFVENIQGRNTRLLYLVDEAGLCFMYVYENINLHKAITR